MSLFRSQIEQERAQSWLGRIVLIRPASFALLTAGALAMTLPMAALFGCGESPPGGEELAPGSRHRPEALHGSGVVSAPILDRERDAVLERQQRIDAARRGRLAIKRELGRAIRERDSANARARAQAAAVTSQ